MATRQAVPAEPKALALMIPPEKVSWREKLAFAHAARETLRQEHNAKGAACRAGTLTDADWETYLSEEFDPRSAAISEAIHDLKFDPPEADLNEVNLKDHFKEKAVRVTEL